MGVIKKTKELDFDGEEYDVYHGFGIQSTIMSNGPDPFALERVIVGVARVRDNEPQSVYGSKEDAAKKAIDIINKDYSFRDAKIKALLEIQKHQRRVLKKLRSLVRANINVQC